MFCFYCGNKMLPGAKFCMGCGQAVVGSLSISSVIRPNDKKGSLAPTISPTKKKKVTPNSNNRVVTGFLIFSLFTIIGAGGYFAFQYYHQKSPANLVSTISDSLQPPQEKFSFGQWLAGQMRGLTHLVAFYSPYILYFLPAILGIILALANFECANAITEKFELWVRSNYQNTYGYQKKLVRFAIHPLLALLVKFIDWTDQFQNRGIKNGVRVSIFLYVIIMWLVLIFSAAMVMVYIAAGVITLIIFYYFLRVISPEGARFIDSVIAAWKKGVEIGRRK